MQVSFNVLIPCMLFTKVAATLAESHDWTLLAIPAVAVIQVRGMPVSYVAVDQAQEPQNTGCLEGTGRRLVTRPRLLLLRLACGCAVG